MNNHICIRLAACLGGLAVITGAFGAHALKAHFSAYQLEIWQTAVFYQMIHALALLALGFSAQAHKLWLSTWAWSLGCFLFCGSLYALALGAPKGFGVITPIGGLAFLVGWFNLLKPMKGLY